MLTAIDISFGLLEGALIGLIVLRYRPHVFVALHAALFWLVIVVLNGISTFVLKPTADYATYALVHTLILLYIMLTVGVGVLLRRSGAAILRTIDELPSASLALCMGSWLAFRLYLLNKYGVASVNLLAFRELVGADYWEVSLIAILRYFAIGGLFAFVLQGALRPRRLLRPGLLMLAGCVMVFAVLLNEVQGARRFLLMLASVVLLASYYRHGLRTLGYGMVAALVFLSAGEYYQRIRENILTPDFVSAVADGDYWTAIRVYLNPSNADISRSTVQALEDRFSPFTVLYEITSEQLERGTTTGGALIEQSFLNVIPSAFIAGKQTINTDEQLADTFYALPYTDLPSGVLVVLQAELGFLGYVVAPMLICFLVIAYSTAMQISANPVLRILFMGLAISTAQLVEELLDAILVTMRDALAAVAFIVALRAIMVLMFPGAPNSTPMGGPSPSSPHPVSPAQR